MSYTLEMAHVDLPNNHFAQIEIISDDDPTNPRTDWDNFGKMVCFHNRYKLGDDHHYSDPQDFLRDLAMELDPTVEDRIDFWEEGRGWEMLDKKYSDTRAYEAVEVKVNAIVSKAIGKAVILPLYLYDHSGITMNTGGFHCPWDSGQVGYIYATPEMIRKEYGVKRITKKVREKVEALLNAEVETYDKYLTGDVWGFVVKVFERHEDAETDCYDEDCADEVEEDSCWGFFGSDYCMEEAKSVAEGFWVDFANVEEIKEVLATPCDCNRPKHGGCRACNTRDLAKRSLPEIDQSDHHKLAVELVKKFHKGNLDDALQAKLFN